MKFDDLVKEETEDLTEDDNDKNDIVIGNRKAKFLETLIEKELGLKIRQNSFFKTNKEITYKFIVEAKNQLDIGKTALLVVRESVKDKSKKTDTLFLDNTGLFDSKSLFLFKKNIWKKYIKIVE